MLSQLKVVCIEPLNDNRLQKDMLVEVRAVPLDLKREKWDIVWEGNVWETYDRWQFEHVITEYAVCEKHYGLFQLPILEDHDRYHYTVLLPGGYVSLISKEDCVIGKYATEQRLGCELTRFR